MTEIEKKIEVKRLEITKNVAELTLECGKLIAENEELKKAITEFSSLVEKMKCCGNCKHSEYSAHEKPCINCSRCFACEDKIIDQWELAE